MLDNEFDQIFRDRLLDHPSKVRQGLWNQVHTHLVRRGLWKQMHTHLVRHNAFWKWYFVGPSAIAVAVTGYFLVSAIRSSSPAKHRSPAAAVATYEARPNPDSAATATPNASTAQAASAPGATPGSAAKGPSTAATAPPSAAATAREPQVAATNPATSNPATSNPAPAGSAVASGSTAPRSATASLAPRSSHTAHRPPARSGNPAGNHQSRRHGSETGSDDATLAADAGSTSAKSTIDANSNSITGSGASRLPSSTTPGSGASRLPGSTAPGSGASRLPGSTAPGSAASRPATSHPPIPAQLTTPAKLATLKLRGDIAAVTANPKKSQQLILPTRRRHKLPALRLDVFGAPEYFTLNTFSLSYGAGVRATFIYKNHWTLTSGLQYLRIGVSGVVKGDSINYIPPGNIKNLHLPLLLGYTTGNSRFTFSANAGILLSLYAHAAGKVTESGWYWPNRNGLNAYLGLNFSSQVTDKVSVFAEPYLKCWYPPYMNFPLRAWSTGLMVGIRYDF